MNRIRLVISLILVVVILSTGTLTASAADYGDYFETMVQFVSGMYYKGMTDEDGLKAALKGLFSNLDKYSAFYDKEETETFNQSLNGNFVGIGAGLEKDSLGAKITRVYKESPAEKAGLLEGDIITAVDGTSVAGKEAEDVAASIRGEEGKAVRLTIKRGNNTKDYSIIRGVVTLSPVQLRIESSMAYIRIESFSLGLGTDFAKAMDEVNKGNIKKIILDLRGNPGGYVDEAVAVAKKLLPPGVITTLDYKSDRMEDRVYTTEEAHPEYIVAVLVDEGSASASEILAGALEDSGVGFLIGRNTYGKGVFQSLFSILTPEAYQEYREQYGESFVTEIEWLSYYGVFPDPEDILGTIKLTTGHYLTPKGRSIDGVGLKPQVVLPNPTLPNGVDLSQADYLSNTAVLKLKDYNADVYDAESILKAAGYYSATSDRLFDTETAEATKKYQTIMGLPVTGSIDSKTRDALNKTLIDLRNKNDQQYAKAVEILNWFRN